MSDEQNNNDVVDLDGDAEIEAEQKVSLYLSCGEGISSYYVKVANNSPQVISSQYPSRTHISVLKGTTVSVLQADITFASGKYGSPYIWHYNSSGSTSPSRTSYYPASSGQATFDWSISTEYDRYCYLDATEEEVVTPTFTAWASGTDSITIRYTASDYPYVFIFYRLASQTTATRLPVYTGGSGGTYTITGLSPGTRYTVNVGWGTSSSDYVGNDPSAAVTVTTDSEDEYAFTVRVSFSSNGGSGAPTYVEETEYGESAPVDVLITIPSTEPVLDGYTFLGWSESKTATRASYSPGTSYWFSGKNPDGTTYITLYAVWSANTYSVTFNANGGSGTMSKQTFSYDEGQYLLANAFTRSGYDFLGWSTNSSATTATYEDEEWVVNITASETITLYAVWQKKQGGFVWIYNGKQWKQCRAYVYNSGWKECSPHIFAGSGWKETEE